MAIKGQTHQKRAREFALKEKRERKVAKKAARAAGELPPTDDDATGDATDTPEAESQPETATAWIQ